MPESEDIPETDASGTLKLVRRLAELVAQHNLAELTVEEDGLAITVRGLQGTLPIAAPPAVLRPAVPTARPAAEPRSGPPVRALSTQVQEAPMVGVFYHSASPEDPPFISIGDVIRLGQPIGLIEAMKVFSEIPAEVAGRVVDLPAANGKLVHQGEPLVVVEPLG